MPMSLYIVVDICACMEAATAVMSARCTTCSPKPRISNASAQPPLWPRECARGGLRVELDNGNEKISYKIREHSLAKVPILLIVGQREAAEGTVALRWLGGKEQEVLALGDAIARLTKAAAVPSSPSQPDALAEGIFQRTRGECK